MKELEMIPVILPEQIETVATLAEKIWNEHYATILTKDQIDYMLNKFLSISAITNQIERQHYEYYILSYEGQVTGFMGLCQEEDQIFLSKLYLDKEFRGKEIARAAVDYVKEISKKRKCPMIWSTVNKNNTISIQFHKKLGFQITGEMVTDIGNGYVMDDYRMEYH